MPIPTLEAGIMDDDTEQRIHDLENAQSSLQEQLDSKVARISELEASNSQLQSRLDQNLADLERERAEKEVAQKGASEAVREREQKEDAIRTVDELRRAATKQGESYDALDNELDIVRGKLRQAERDRGDALDEAELKARELASVNRRASSLQSQCADLEKELDERSKALSTYRGEKTQEIMQIMSQLVEATRRAENAEGNTAAVKRTADGLQARLARVEGELNAVLEQSAADKAGLERQLALQTNLTNLQKQKADEAMTKIEHLRAEVRGLEGKVAAEMDNTAKERKRADEVRDKSKAVVEELKAKLEEKEAQQKMKEDGILVTNGQRANGHAFSAQPLPVDLSADLNGLNEDELKMCVMQMERELEAVRGDRDRQALFLTRILREVDHKSPLLMSSKKDYQRVLQSHEQLFLKVEDSMRRCQRAEREREDALSTRDNLARELDTAKDSLADLGAQVQKLIRTNLERDLGRPLVRVGEGNRGRDRNTPSKRTGREVAIVPGGEIVPHEPEPEPDKIIAEHMVTFEDVRQMQERNRMLLQVTRRLTAELKDMKMARNMEREVQQEKVVSDLRRQLEELNAARERQTELLKTITESRDTYRQLLGRDGGNDGSGSSAHGGGGSSLASVAAAQELEAMKSRMHELERDLGVSRDEARKLQESLKHLADDVTNAERAQSKAQAELASTQRMLSHSEDRVRSLVQDRDMKTVTIARETEKFQKLSDNVIKLQGYLERQKNEAVTAQNEGKDLSLTNQALRVDKRIMEESEKRLRDENMSLRKEVRHKETLLDNLANRDRAFGAHKDAEISSLREELNRLRREAEKDRRAGTDAEMTKQKVLAELKEAEREMETLRSTLQAETASAKAAAEQAIEAEKAASKRSVELAARLQEARARLVTDGGDGGVGSGSAGGALSEDGISSQLAEIRKLGLELQATKVELKTKEGVLATIERQRAQYEAIGKSRQHQISQLRGAMKEVEEELTAKMKEAEARAKAAEAEVRSTKTGLASTVAELIKEKEAAEREIASSRKAVAKLKDEIEASGREVMRERSRADGVKKDMEEHQRAAKAAEERYRQELEAHAGAITALRQAEEAQDELALARREADSAKDALAADLMRARVEWEAHKASLKQACKNAEERLSSAKAENSVLLEHLQTLNQQLEADEKKRQEADKAVADRVVGGGADDGVGENSERLRLARSVKELHELVRHKQRDIQVVTMNLEMSTQKISTLEAELDRTKASLREAREEMQKAARVSVDAVSKTEHRKLLDEVAQISTLRESNIMLRNSLREAEERSRLAQARVKELEQKTAPLQQAERKHAATAAALVSDKASLRREVENWKKRVTSLTASFNAVDPKEHEEVLEERNDLKKALVEAEKVNGVLETHKAELTKAKAAAEKQRDEVNTVKSKLTSQVTELRKALDGARREGAAQKAAATRDLEAKLSAEKEKASKAASEALVAKQEAARVRNSISTSVRNLNEQLAKAKAEVEALRSQPRQSHAKDSTSQEAALRKKISELEEAMAAKDRENMTNRSMYDKMKKVNRNIKENLETSQQEVKDREEDIAKLQARMAELEEERKSPQPPQGVTVFNTPAPSLSPNAGATAVLVADATTASASAAAGRQSRSVSPNPPVVRALSPTASASAMASDGLGAGEEGGDGGESALRNRLMARSKRPLGPSEPSGTAKRVHKPPQSDESSSTSSGPTSSSTSTSATPATTTTSALGSPSSAVSTPMPLSTASTKPTFNNGSFSSSGSSGSSGGVTTQSAPPATEAPPASTPASDSSTAPAAVVASSATSGLNPAASPFSFGVVGWGGLRRPATGTALSTLPSSTDSTTATAGPGSASAPATSSPIVFGGMGNWGGGRRASVMTPPSSAAATLTSSVTGSFVSPALTTSAQATNSAGGGEGSGGASGKTAAGAASGASAAAPSTSGVFGSGTGFAGFGGAGRLGGTKLASLKPPSKDAQFKTFPKINLPVPSGAKSSGSSSRVSFPTVPSASTPAFGVPPGTSQQPQQQQQQHPSFGSVGQVKFGFGSGSATFSSFAPSSPSATSTAVPPGSDGEASSVVAAVAAGVEASTDGASGGSAGGADVPTVVADSAAVAAATAGVPGPGLLMLDVEARRAARERRFATQPPGSAPVSNQMSLTASPAGATPHASSALGQTAGGDGAENTAQPSQEEGEIDEEDEGDPV